MSETVQDVLCLGIPKEIDPAVYLSSGATVKTSFYRHLNRLAYETVWAQWRSRVPVDVEFEEVEWLITQDIARIAEFQPAHDCEECRLGNRRAEAFLREFPGRWVAMGNLTYTVRWE